MEKASVGGEYWCLNGELDVEEAKDKRFVTAGPTPGRGDSQD